MAAPVNPSLGSAVQQSFSLATPRAARGFETDASPRWAIKFCWPNALAKHGAIKRRLIPRVQTLGPWLGALECETCSYRHEAARSSAQQRRKLPASSCGRSSGKLKRTALFFSSHNFLSFAASSPRICVRQRAFVPHVLLHALLILNDPPSHLSSLLRPRIILLLAAPR